MRCTLPIAILLTIVTASCAWAGSYKDSSPETTIRSIYEAHKPWLHKELILTDRSTANNLLTRALADLIQLDAICSKKIGEVGVLDFDPILYAQDFDDQGIGDLKIKILAISTNTAKVLASFFIAPKDKKSQKTIIYSLKIEGSIWKIDDISYPSIASLKKSLSQPVVGCEGINP
jgi:Protein of unknown function (DUF3828)